MLNHGAHMFMAAPEDNEEGDIDEGFLCDTPWHTECTADVLTNFATVGNLILVMGNALGKCILNEVDLFNRSFVRWYFSRVLKNS